MNTTESLREALLLVLDQVDYTAGACEVTEMVGACLPVEVIERAKAALAPVPMPGMSEAEYQRHLDQLQNFPCVVLPAVAPGEPKETP